MLYLIFCGGLVIGACVGLVTAGLMWMAKQSDEPPFRSGMIDAEVLAAMVNQHCTTLPDGRVYSCGLSSNEDAILALIIAGRMEADFVSDDGHVVYARWVNPPMDPVAAEIANDNAPADAGKGVA